MTKGPWYWANRGEMRISFSSPTSHAFDCTNRLDAIPCLAIGIQLRFQSFWSIRLKASCIFSFYWQIKKKKTKIYGNQVHKSNFSCRPKEKKTFQDIPKMVGIFRHSLDNGNSIIRFRLELQVWMGLCYVKIIIRESKFYRFRL